MNTKQSTASALTDRQILDAASHIYNLGSDGKGFTDDEAIAYFRALLSASQAEDAKDNLDGLPDILREASKIIAAIRMQDFPPNYRQPIIDELNGFALMVEEFQAQGAKQI